MSGPDFAAEIAAQLAQAHDAENRRRQLAGQATGLGALVSLADVPYGPSVGKSGLDLPFVGEGYSQGPLYVPQSKSYGPEVPVYAPDVVGGVSYAPGRVETVPRSLGEAVFARQDARAAGPRVVVVSPDLGPRRSLWSRLRGALRRGR